MTSGESADGYEQSCRDWVGALERLHELSPPGSPVAEELSAARAKCSGA